MQKKPYNSALTFPTRLDRLIASRFPSFSRSFLQRFIQEIGVKINGLKVKKPHTPLQEKDLLEVQEKDIAAFMEAQLAAQDTKRRLDKALVLLHDAADFIVIDKPPFVNTESLARGFYPVHRLDKNTSGVLVLAKNPATHRLLQAQWAARTVRKTYLSLVTGILTPLQGAIEAGVSRSKADRRKMSISQDIHARAALTEYRVKAYLEDSGLPSSFTLLLLYPKTGRTHQIRVHVKSIGHPVVGDEAYGDKRINRYFAENFSASRQFLHATELEFDDPIGGARLKFTSPLPEDLQKILDSLTEVTP